MAGDTGMPLLGRQIPLRTLSAADLYYGNGMSCHDNVEADGSVHDANRIQFLDEYLGNLQKAADEGAEIAGYFLWTFLDNFEWHEGYSERFGIIYVDYATQQRYVKDSAFWYKKVMESNGVALSCNQPDRKSG